MLNLVIPMAGRGSRFQLAGYAKPKPLIPVGDKTMIEVVIQNLRPRVPHRFIFICQREHDENFAISSYLKSIESNCELVFTDGVTEGAACTVLLARDYIDNDEQLIIANSDQWIDADIDEFIADWEKRRCAGFIMTMKSNNDKWSYVRYDNDGHISGVVEKDVVSDDATVGVYGFQKGRLFCSAADRMVAEERRSKGEFYVAPVYDYLIEEGRSIGTWSIGRDQDGMYGLGTPVDLEYFLAHPKSRAL